MEDTVVDVAIARGKRTSYDSEDAKSPIHFQDEGSTKEAASKE